MNMRLAVVSDVHGNLTALEAVISDIERQAPDQVLCAGDFALMGAQPAEVIDRVRALGWPSVVGNVDELLWRPDERVRQEARGPKLRPLLRLMFESYAPATREILGRRRMSWLQALPQEIVIEGLRVLHAAPGDLWRAPRPDADNGELEETYANLADRVWSTATSIDPTRGASTA
jgi:Icc-related predicted phosphoesterase